MAHRGPDGEGHHFEPGAALSGGASPVAGAADGGVGLGHRRLSIIDVSGGGQPMSNEDGSIVVVFNGEIYNYLELIPDLLARGHVFKTHCDTEVILHLYEEMGPACVDRFNGMFAFALWDRPRRRLMLARDRLGEKPLFYHLGDGRIAFSSELKSLLKAPGVPRDFCVEALDDYLAYGYVPTDKCILKGVSKLPPGCRLIYENGRATVERYWDVDFATRGPAIPEQEWMEELERRLRESIRIRLRSDVPLGVFLSGGVDSSAVVALASQEMSGRLQTFSIDFEESSHSEARFARMVAERYNTEHRELTVRDRDISIFPDLVYHLDEPFADPSALPTFYVCREARRFVTVCLSGDGGDEVFAGYERYAQSARYERWDRFAPRPMRALVGAVGTSLPPYVPGAGMLTRAGADGADRYFAQCSKFTADERARLLRPEFRSAVHADPWLFAPYFANGAGATLTDRLQHADQKTYLPDDILVKVDRMSMKTSLEVRVPFLDHTLIEFANASPVAYKLHAGSGKHLLKRMLEKHLPREVMYRPKRGFGLPIKTWFRAGLSQMVRDVLLASDSRSAQWLEPSSVSRLVADHERGGRDLSEKVWTLLVFELWCRQYGF